MENKDWVHPRQLDRRSGRTTRDIDHMVQLLFTDGYVNYFDHAQSPDNMALDDALRRLQSRLYYEHNLKQNADYTINRKEQRLTLLKFQASPQQNLKV